MTFAHPLALLAALALPILWWLHRARLRPQPRDWPSLYLWKRLPPPSPAAQARFRRRTTLALLLALAAASAFTLGASEPSMAVFRREPPRVGVVLDATASTQGVFESLRSDALAFVEGLPADAVVSFAIVPVLERANASRSEALDALRDARPTDAPGNPAAVAAHFASADLTAIFSDAPGPAEVGVWRVRPSGPERDAVVSLTGDGGELLAVIRHFGPAATVRWTADIDGRRTTGETPVAADSHTLLKLPAPGAQLLAVELEADPYPATDRRYWRSDASPKTIGLAGRDFPALRRALEAAGVRIALDAPPSIWVGEVPDAAPSGPAIFIDPPRGVLRLFDLGDVVSDPTPVFPEPEDPLVRTSLAADFSRLQAPRSRLLLAGPRPLVAPLIYQQGQTLILTFDPARSNWPRLVSFPLFWRDVARQFGWASARNLPTSPRFPEAGLTTDAAVNLEDPLELNLPPLPPLPPLPSLDLPEKDVLLSRRTLPPAGAALAGVLLLALSWLAMRSTR